jgi:hypothetical protein
MNPFCSLVASAVALTAAAEPPPAASIGSQDFKQPAGSSLSAEAVPQPEANAANERSRRLVGDWGEPQRRLGLELDRIGTREALKKLAAQAGWSIVFKADPRGRVDMAFNDTPADVALLAILEQSDLVAERDGDVVTIRELGAAAWRHGRGADRTSIGGSVHVIEDETVREAVALGGELRVDGTVQRDAVSVLGDVIVGPKAVIKGNVVSVGGHLNIDPRASISGDRVAVPLGLSRFLERAHQVAHAKMTVLERMFSLLKSALSWAVFFVLGLVMLALAPERVRVVGRDLRRDPARSAAVGLAATVAVMPLSILLVLTLVGILVLPFLALFFAAGVLLGMFGLAIEAGASLPGRRERRTQVAMLALGAALLFLICQVPYLGPVILFAAGIASLGAALRTRFGSGQRNEANCALGQ